MQASPANFAKSSLKTEFKSENASTGGCAGRCPVSAVVETGTANAAGSGGQATSTGAGGTDDGEGENSDDDADNNNIYIHHISQRNIVTI